MAFLFLFYGWYVKIDLPRLIGFLMIFLLGGMLEPALPGSVEYLNGSVSTVAGNVTTLSHSYAVFQAHTLGLFLALAGVLGFILVMADRRREARG